MRSVMICALLVATTSIAEAEAQRARNPVAQPTVQRSDQTTQQAPVVETPPRGTRDVEQTANEHGRQLTACFAGVSRKITMIVVVSYDGKKLRSSVKPPSRAAKQIEACVVGVFDHITFRLPARPITIELPVEYTPAIAGV